MRDSDGNDITLKKGSLVIVDPDTASETAILNGTSYTWIKVIGFHSMNKPKSIIKDADDEFVSSIEVTGWVARELTEACSFLNSDPQKSAVISTTNKNLSSSQHEMLVNARYIYNYMINI